MSFTDQMASLRTSLNDTKRRTNQAVRDVKSDTNRIIRGAQTLVTHYAQTQKANAQALRTDLKNATQGLKKRVKEIRGTNMRERRERQREFAQAQAIFWGKQKPEKNS